MKFIKSAEFANQFIIDGKPEVCFIGRSNVGKSSVINAIANNKISRTSNTPGRTQLINFFDNDKYRLVDLPGYGYAKVSKVKRAQLSAIIDEYLVKSKNLKAVFQICDANVITELDQKMSIFFENNYPNHFIILNKIDKQKMFHYKNALTEVASFLNISQDRLILVSATKRINIKELSQLIFNVCQKKENIKDEK